MLTLTHPLAIAPNLGPGVRIGDGWLAVTGGTPATWSLHLWDATAGIDYPFEVGAPRFGGTNVRGTIRAALSFLAAAAESYDYGMRTGEPGENADLFPADVTEWAHANADEIGMLAYEIEEGEAPID